LALAQEILLVHLITKVEMEQAQRLAQLLLLVAVVVAEVLIQPPETVVLVVAQLVVSQTLEVATLHRLAHLKAVMAETELTHKQVVVAVEQMLLVQPVVP